MNFFTHTVTQCSIDQLVALYQSLACKGVRDDQCAEMLTITFDFKVGAVQIRGDVGLDAIRSGQHNFAFIKK